MNTSSGFFFFFWGVFFWLCGLFADDIGKRMHDKRFRFFYWTGSEMKLQRLDFASEVFQLFELLKKLVSSMHRGNYNSLHELLVQSLIDYHLSVRGLCFSFGDHRWLLLFLAVIVRCQVSSWLFLQENRKKKKEKKEPNKIGCKKEHGHRLLDPQFNAFTKSWDYNYDFVFVT